MNAMKTYIPFLAQLYFPLLDIDWRWIQRVAEASQEVHDYIQLLM
jgi:hypothetical protein